MTVGKQSTARPTPGDDSRGRGQNAGLGNSREDEGMEGDATTGAVGDEELDGFNDEDMPLTWGEVRFMYVDTFFVHV